MFNKSGNSAHLYLCKQSFVNQTLQPVIAPKHFLLDMTSYANALYDLASRDQVCTAFGIKISPNAQVVQIAKNAGFRSLFIDLEHGWLSLAEASNLSNIGHLSGITPFVRVPHQCGAGFVQRVLDGGAMGVIFPHIHNSGTSRNKSRH
jgi:2-keto-3-deoxy-L-rhamnonate aldolase RhmA